MRHSQFKRLAAIAAGALFLATAGPASAFDSAIVRSILLPGAGQAQQGHYTRAAVFAAAAIASGAGLFATQIHYDRAVESFDDLKDLYTSYPGRLESGEVISEAEINDTYAALLDAEDDADSRLAWRNAFLGALIATYTINLIDVIMSDPDTGELSNASGLSVEMRGTDVRVVKSFSF
jgi:hypothetical protein